MTENIDDAVFIEIRKFIGEKLSIAEDKITPESSFINDLQADSLDLVELTMELETKYDIQISDEDSKKFTCVNDVVEFIKKSKSS